MADTGTATHGDALTVSEVSRLAGVSVRALHHYDEIGLLVPSARTDAGYRLYSRDDLDQGLQAFARVGRKLGVIQ